MKTHGKITLTTSTNHDDPPGTLHWRLPTGLTYTSRPTTLTTHLRPEAEDPPPF